MAIELTEQQRQQHQEHPGEPIEFVDPRTQQSYFHLPREQHERVRCWLPSQAEP